MAHFAASSEASSQDETTEALIALSLDGHVLAWNSGAESTFGYSTNEAIGKRIEELVACEAPGVLVVDDDGVQLKLIRIHLLQLGFKVLVAASATEALRLARQGNPDVILSDVLMPDVDGFQLCFEVRRDPQLHRIPVVLLSAHYHADADADLAQKVGANALVARTPALDTLGAAISEAIERGPPAALLQPSEHVQLEHARAVIRQLDRQLQLSEGMVRRSALQAAQLALLGGIADALARRADMHSVLRDVLAATLDAAAISKGALFLVDADDKLELRHAVGFTQAEASVLPSFFGHRPLLERAISQRMPVSLPSAVAPRAVAADILLAADAATLEIIPLASAEHALGAMVLAARRTDLSSDDAVIFARAIGSQIVQALELEATFMRLTATELRYRALMENASDAINILTADGIVRETNRQTEKILGLSRECIIGRHIREFAAPGSEAQNVSSFDRAVSTREGRTPPTALRHADGSIRLLEFSNTSVELAGEPVVIAIGRDVTEQIRANAQLIASDRMASIGLLAAGVAHEINNPLAAITANLDLAERDVGELRGRLGATGIGELGEEIHDAREAAERVRAIARDLKVFSRAEDERHGPVDVHQVLDSSLRIARSDIRQRARLVREYGGILPVVANESRLGQVFLNLVVNAAQAIGEGRAQENEIRVRTFTENGCVVVEVSDTGVGMSPETQSKLFAAFFTTKPSGEGTGLGLTICQRIVEGLGGQILVSSELGKGTQVRVTLPAAPPAQERPITTPPHAIGGAVSRRKILIIDDDPMVLSALRRTLKSEHDVVAVSRAREALERIAGGERFDALICDLMMPEMTGIDFYRELGVFAPDQPSRVIFSTGGAFTPSARAFLDTIENPVLYKPFDFKALRALVAAAPQSSP